MNYHLLLQIDDARQVSSTSCTCVYKESGICKHVAALIHYVNNEDSVTKTAVKQQWGKPSVKKFAQEKYCKGKYISEMYPPRKRKKNVAKPRPVDPAELVDDCPLKWFYRLKARANVNSR